MSRDPPVLFLRARGAIPGRCANRTPQQVSLCACCVTFSNLGISEVDSIVSLCAKTRKQCNVINFALVGANAPNPEPLSAWLYMRQLNWQAGRSGPITQKAQAMRQGPIMRLQGIFP